jgi:hypothetical protein
VLSMKIDRCLLSWLRWREVRLLSQAVCISDHVRVTSKTCNPQESHSQGKKMGFGVQIQGASAGAGAVGYMLSSLGEFQKTSKVLRDPVTSQLKLSTSCPSGQDV